MVRVGESHIQRFIEDKKNNITVTPITQHKRFVHCGTNPNFCFAKTSSMLKPLGENLCHTNIKENH